MNVKKKKGALSYFSTLDAGDPEKNAERFNNSTADNVNVTAMSEDWEHKDVRYMSDMLGDLMGNMSEDQLDADLKLFARIARKLRVRNMDDLVVMLDRNNEYDPQYYMTEIGQKIGPVYKGKEDAVEYEMFGAHLVAENTPTGLFLYFPDETSGRKYVTAVDRMMNENYSRKKICEANTENADRTNLIQKIRSFGKNYDFDKYTDQQLFRIANRLQDAADIEDVMREFAEIRNRQAEKKAYDAEYDIPDETYEESLTVRQKLSRMDEACLDNGNYLDLRNLFEAVTPNMTPEEKEELRKVVNATNDPEIISAYLNGKYKQKDEGLKEDYTNQLFNKLKQAVMEFLDFADSMEWDMPSGYIYDNWKDWMDDTNFSASVDSVESAENLLSEYKRIYEVDKRLAPRLEDWETDEFIRLYEKLKTTLDAAIKAWEEQQE